MAIKIDFTGMYPSITFEDGHRIGFNQPIAGRAIKVWSDHGDLHQVFTNEGWAYVWHADEKKNRAELREIALQSPHHRKNQ